MTAERVVGARVIWHSQEAGVLPGEKDDRSI
jgi:hypothetical protein